MSPTSGVRLPTVAIAKQCEGGNPFQTDSTPLRLRATRVRQRRPERGYKTRGDGIEVSV
ncbi:hypothetical protein KKF55_06155 [Patescibacteria group bacterium]|nr:hypothetical protein [Patescibacteria group bacterium]